MFYLSDYLDILTIESKNGDSRGVSYRVEQQLVHDIISICSIMAQDTCLIIKCNQNET